MKIKTAELTGAALDWVVCILIYGRENVELIENIRSEGYTFRVNNSRTVSPSTDWAQGGPIVDREDITWSMGMEPEHQDVTRWCAFSYRAGSSKAQFGPTKLIAAMRCYVASKLGDEVEIPEELL